MEDPEPYLDSRGIELHSFFDESRPAVLDVDHRARVNHELFFFADEAEAKRFRDDPLAYCGTVTDPVTHTRFEPDADSPRIDYNGQPFFFASNLSHSVFSTMPDSFVVPRLKMPYRLRSRKDQANSGRKVITRSGVSRR